MDLKDKRVLVVGLGKSGVASALFLKNRGARVTVSDTKSPDQLREEIPVLLDHGITVETGGHGERTFRGQDLIVVSPGVPVDAPPLVQARASGEPVIGEIELAAHPRRLPGVAALLTAGAVGLAGAPPFGIFWGDMMIGGAASKFTDGRLTDEATRKFVADLLVSLVAWTKRLQASK